MKRKLTFLLFTITSCWRRLRVRQPRKISKYRPPAPFWICCTTAPDSPIYKEAVHFCHGFLVGAIAYHLAENAGPEGKPLVCFPDPAPSRTEGIAMFVDWLKAHPEFMDEKPVEAEFRFLDREMALQALTRTFERRQIMRNICWRRFWWLASHSADARACQLLNNEP